MASKTSTQKIFSKPIGAILIELGMSSETALQQALTIQERYLALYTADKLGDVDEQWETSDEYIKICNSWDETVKEYNIGNDILQSAKQQISAMHQSDNNFNSLPTNNIPAAGAIFIELGTTQENDVHAVLTAQAAQRILNTAESMVKFHPPEKVRPISLIEEIKNNPVWERSNTPSTPEYLAGNQHILFIAKLLEATMFAHPPLAETKALERAESAFLVLSAAAFQEARERSPAVSGKINEVSEYMKSVWNIELPVTPSLAHASLQAINNAVEAVDISLGQRYADEQIAQSKTRQTQDE